MNEEFFILNIREYLRQGEGGEDLLKQVLSTFSCKKNNKKLLDFYEKQNGFKRFDTKEIKSGTEDTHTLVQLLKVL